MVRIRHVQSETFEEFERRYKKAMDVKRALKPVPSKCHDCHVEPGKPHRQGCDSPLCTICGEQLMSCGHKAGNSVHTGIERQEVLILCEAMSLFCKSVVTGERAPGLPDFHWELCSRDDPEARYDLNRGTELYVAALEMVRKRAWKELEGDE